MFIGIDKIYHNHAHPNANQTLIIVEILFGKNMRTTIVNSNFLLKKQSVNEIVFQFMKTLF